ncbi:metallophosphoesterase family protein [Tenggerimyces flavus]|uniref:Tat pathway signal sequence domain protein n=1 Tax=Tenggerimyces flavus TaxID=1708749 RepID=A0ABV7YDT3_9ACTN|nr:Tat pathway signal sequence domain protein [Tenggerimyces flavus]MBM7791398.1 hypothetical protein [Tenggerimyces flavus]
MNVARRRLLQAAAAAPVVALATDLPAAQAQAETSKTGKPAASTDRFTLAVLPDTQYLLDEGGSDHEPVRATLRYLVNERDRSNLVFMAQLGDITEHGTEAELRDANTVFKTIDGRLPYSVLAGNHDVPGSTDDQRGDTPYLRTFGPQRFARSRTYGGSSPDGYNSFHRFRAAGHEWLVLALDWRVSDAGLAWTQQVLDKNRQLPTILTTHELVWAEDNGEAHLSDYGQRLWDRLIRGNDQIFLALGGHYWPPGRVTMDNDAGNAVHLHITNYQDRYYGGAGMVRTYEFDLARNTVDVSTFSPWLREQAERSPDPLEVENADLTTGVDRFNIDLDFRARFAGFAPPKLPAPRPPKAVMPRGTVAYWRFDPAGISVPGADGTPITSGAVVRDLTGSGNDLTVERLHSSGPDALLWSADHHDAQPAHASLRFGGGKAPDRGAVLRAGASAPINSLKFRSGYTSRRSSSCPIRSRATTRGWGS